MKTTFAVGFLTVSCLGGLVACAGQMDGESETVTPSDRVGNPRPERILENGKPTMPTPMNPAVPVEGSGASGALRLLSRVEYDNSIRDLLGDNTQPGSIKLPEEIVGPDNPFDTLISVQEVNGPFVAAAEGLAEAVAARALADPATRKRLVPCTPVGPSDPGCLKTVISSFGRRAFRRPLSDEDITRYLTFQTFGVEKKDFYVSVEMIVQEMLQDPEFLYRLEVGTQVAGSAGQFKLNGYEMATRLSYFMRGSTPTDALLSLAEANKLSSPADVRAAAMGLLSDPAFKERMQDFHAQWLGYRKLPHDPALSRAMQVETRALVDRVLFDRPSSYLDLFLSKDTFVDGLLAKQYGLAPPAKAGWVPYSAGRVGILSHGTVLSASSIDPGDTHVPKRGLYVSSRLMCRPIPPPPVDIDTKLSPPTDSPCKKEQHIARTQGPTCRGCHSQMDPIGFGLENYDAAGKYRTQEEKVPTCTISGEGALPEGGTFKGVDGLTTALVNSGRIEDCSVRQIFRFAMGRSESGAESAALDKVVTDFRTNKRPFRDVLLEIVSAGSFGLRFDSSGKGN